MIVWRFRFFLILAWMYGSLAAHPTGMRPISGNAASRTLEKTLRVVAGDRTILEWEHFSIAPEETVQFTLPDASSSVLNRVTGGQTSELMGLLQSNGQVLLINPQGVIVGKEAQIDTANFIASTFDLLNDSFLAKEAVLQFQGDSNASIVNLGTIATATGNVFLLARHVENVGNIEAPNGTVALAGGSHLLLMPDQSRKVFIQPSASEQNGVSIQNHGQIEALVVEMQAGSSPYAAAICHNGTIDALGLKKEHGRVLLVAEEGRIDITGNIRASASEQASRDAPREEFGEIGVLAREIYVTKNAVLDVSNPTGGGLISLGYELDAGGARAAKLATTSDVVLNADATARGDGGLVKMWGGDIHSFAANVSAKGGAAGGDGGSIEASTLGMMDPLGLANTSAPFGKAGTLIYDPADIQIATSDINIGVVFDAATKTFIYHTSNPSLATRIDATALEKNLTRNNVVISTEGAGEGYGDITVTQTVSWTPALSPTSLSLFASRDLVIDANIIANGTGEISLTSMRDTIIQGASVATNAGALSCTANRNFCIETAEQTAASSIATISGALNLVATNYYDGTSSIALRGSQMSSAGAAIQSDSGDIMIRGSGSLFLDGSAQITTSGTGNIAINTACAESLSPSFGHLTLTACSTASNTSSASIVTKGSGSIAIHVGHGNLEFNGSKTAFSGGARIQAAGEGTIDITVDGDMILSSHCDAASVGIMGDHGNEIHILAKKDCTFSGGMTHIDSGMVGAGAVFFTSGSMNVEVLGNLKMNGGAVSGLGSNRACIEADTLRLAVGGTCSLVGGATASSAAGAGSSIIHSNRLYAQISGNLYLDSHVEEGGSACASIGGVLTTDLLVGGSAFLTGHSRETGNGSVEILAGRFGIDLTCLKDLVLTGGGNSNSYARIGAPQSHAGSIHIKADHIVLEGGSSWESANGFALIGHGTAFHDTVNTASISVEASGSIRLKGGSGVGSFAQIGHLARGEGTYGGDLFVRAAQSISMSGGQEAAGANATIGHHYPGQTPTYELHTVTAIAGLDVRMDTFGKTGGIAQILNPSAQTQNAITIICDNNSSLFPDYGTGNFLFKPHSKIVSAAGALGQVRIYSSVRIFNTTQISGTCGTNTYWGSAINGLNPAPSPVGVNAANEIWGVYADPTVAGGGGVYKGTPSFILYYKRVGGILIGGMNTAASDGTPFSIQNVFPANRPEIWIHANHIKKALEQGDFTIDAELLSPRAAGPLHQTLNGNSIVLSDVENIFWNSPNTLTLRAGNDVRLEGKLFPIFAGRALLQSGRDCILGNGSCPAVIGSSEQGSLHIATGRDLHLLSSGMKGEEIVLTVGRDLHLLSSDRSACIQANTLTCDVARNCLQKGGFGRESRAEIVVAGFNGGTLNIGGEHVLQGGSGGGFSKISETPGSCAAIAAERGLITHTVGAGLTLLGGTSIGGRAAISSKSAEYRLSVSHGNLSLVGGAGASAVIETREGDVSLDISVLNGSLLMQSAEGEGNAVIQNIGGALSIFAGGDLKMMGGKGPVSLDSDANRIEALGPLLIVAGQNLIQTGGSGINTGSSILGKNVISLNIGQDHVLQGGLGRNSRSLVKSSFHDPSVQGVVSKIGGHLMIFSGSDLFALAGYQSGALNQSTGMTIICGNSDAKTGDLVMKGGSFDFCPALIRMGCCGHLNVTAHGHLVMTAGSSGSFSGAFIGDPENGGIAPINNVLHVKAGQHIVLNGVGYNCCVIGNGGGIGTVVHDVGGSVAVTSGGDLILNGASDGRFSPAFISAEKTTAFRAICSDHFFANGGFSVIGHINGPYGGGTLSGVITAAAEGSLILNGGSATSSFAQIGSGGMKKLDASVDHYAASIVTAQAGRNIVLSTTSLGTAKIVNYGSDVGSSILLITDQNYPKTPEFGTGRFEMSKDSQILTSLQGVNPNTSVRIYTPVRIFNAIEAAAINGSSFTPGELGVKSEMEQWGVYGPSDGMYKAWRPFVFYYKQIGGVLISSAPDSGHSFKDDSYQFHAPEANLNALQLSALLGVSSVHLKTANSIVIKSPISWVANTSLTIDSPQDLVIDNGLAAMDGTGSGRIELHAGRDLFVGDAAQSNASIVATSSASVIAEAGNCVNVYGGSVLGAAAGILVQGRGSLTIKAGNGCTLFGGSFHGTAPVLPNLGTSASAVLGSAEGITTLCVAKGDLNIRGGVGDHAIAAIQPPSVSPTSSFSGEILSGHFYSVGGVGQDAYAAIDWSNGSVAASSPGSVALSIPSGGLTACGGSGARSFSLCKSDLGNLHLTVNGGDFVLKGGSGFSSKAHVHSVVGSVFVSSGKNVQILAGSGGFSFAGIESNGNGDTKIVGKGNLKMAAQNNGWATIGGENLSVPQHGHITVAVDGSISLFGEVSGRNSDERGFAQIGHVSGDIDVTAGGGVTLQGGAFYGSGAWIGHGGQDGEKVRSSYCGSTSISADCVNVLAGQGVNGGCAMIAASGAGTVFVSANTGNIVLKSGGSSRSPASISSFGGACKVKAAQGDVILQAGLGSVVAGANISTTTGVVDVFVGNKLVLSGGRSDRTPVFIGPVGSANTSVSVAGDCMLTSGLGIGSFAQIGGIGLSSGAVCATIGGYLKMTAFGAGFVQVGNGGVQMPAGVVDGAITMRVKKQILMEGSQASSSGVPLAYGGFGFSHIGHLNSQKTNTMLSGDITVVSGESIILQPGLKTAGSARIGHGGLVKCLGSASVDAYGLGTTTVIADDSIVLAKSAGTILSSPLTNSAIYAQTAQIVNPCRGDVRIVVDNRRSAMANGVGAGRFALASSNGFIASPNGQTRIYTYAPASNALAVDSKVRINGCFFYALPPGHLEGHEEWGYTFETDATNPYRPPFTIYYK